MDTESALSSIPNSDSRFWVIESEEGREARSLFRTCPIIIFFIALRYVATVTHGWRLLLLAVSSATGNGVNTDEHLRDLRAGLPVSHASFELSVSVSLEQQTLSPTPPSQFYGHMSQLTCLCEHGLSMLFDMTCRLPSGKLRWQSPLDPSHCAILSEQESSFMYDYRGNRYLSSALNCPEIE